MIKTSDFGGGNVKSKYCTKCSYTTGGLKPKHEIREGMILYYMKVKKWERGQAAQFVDELMAGKAAWQ